MIANPRIGSRVQLLKRPEGELVKACLHFLHLRGILAWRCNSGATVAEHKGKRRFIKYQSINGVSDILAVLDGGKILAVECKNPGNKPSPDQASFLEGVASRGGVAVVAYSVDDVEKAVAAAKPEAAQ